MFTHCGNSSLGQPQSTHAGSSFPLLSVATAGQHVWLPGLSGWITALTLLITNIWIAAVAKLHVAMVSVFFTTIWQSRRSQSHFHSSPSPSLLAPFLPSFLPPYCFFFICYCTVSCLLHDDPMGLEFSAECGMKTNSFCLTLFWCDIWIQVCG